jgi:hypothetical protein
MSKLALATTTLLLLFPGITTLTLSAADLQVGTAAVELVADDSMVIAGGILPRYVKGQEGKLRAVAVVLEKAAQEKLAIVSCDVLMLTRDLTDPVVEEIERACGIPASGLMIHATHTHHAPSTMSVHGYGRDEVFCRRLQRAIVKAVTEADARLAPAAFHFKRGEETTVGQNSRIQLADGSIYWIGYLPDREAHRLGGYQVWTGLHSYTEPGTGERMVEEAVKMLEELAR